MVPVIMLVALLLLLGTVATTAQAAGPQVGGAHPVQYVFAAPDGSWVLYRQLREPPDDSEGPHLSSRWASPEWMGPADLHLALPDGRDLRLVGQELVSIDTERGWLLVEGGGLLTLIRAQSGERLVLGSGDSGQLWGGQLLYLVGGPLPGVYLRELRSGRTRRITRAGAAWFSADAGWILTCPDPAPIPVGDVSEQACFRRPEQIRAFPLADLPTPALTPEAWLMGEVALDRDAEGRLQAWRAGVWRPIELPEGCGARVLWGADDGAVAVVACGDGPSAPLYRVRPEGEAQLLPITLADTGGCCWQGELVQVGTRVWELRSGTWREPGGEGLLLSHGDSVYEWDGEDGSLLLLPGVAEVQPWPPYPPLEGGMESRGRWAIGRDPSGGWSRCDLTDMSCLPLSGPPQAVADDGRVLVAARLDAWGRPIGPMRWEYPRPVAEQAPAPPNGDAPPQDRPAPGRRPSGEPR